MFWIKANHFKRNQNTYWKKEYCICLHACHVTKTNVRIMNLQTWYFIIKIIILKSQGYFK